MYSLTTVNPRSLPQPSDHDSPNRASITVSSDEVELQEMAPVIDDGEDTAPLIAGNPDNESADSISSSRSTANLFVWMLTLSSCISGLLFGYDTGVISSTLVSIGTDLSSRTLTSLDKGLITSATSFFALIASPVAGILSDKLGRKRIIIFADLLFTLGAVWQALCSSVWSMIVGRSLVGLAIGGASLIVPLYISELAPGHMRGRLVTVSLLFITGGQVVAYIVGWAFSTVPSGWRWMVGLGAAPALIQLLSLIFTPETPRFLAKINKEHEAKKVLEKVYRGSVNDLSSCVNAVIKAIKAEIFEEEEAERRLKSSQHSSSMIPAQLRSLLFHPPHARALTITCMLQGLQQLCGFNSIMYFSATIFELLQFSSPTLTALSIAITNFAFTVLAFYLIDRTGRRRILLYTIPMMVVALLLCALAFTTITLPDGNLNHNTETQSPTRSHLPAIAILISLILYVSPYATGLGPVPWQQSELFPLSVRSLGSGIATATNWGCNTIVGLTFLPMMEMLTPGWTFVTYAGICALGWVAVWFIYPETMGLDLEDVGSLLKDGWGVEESMKRLEQFKAGQKQRSNGRESLGLET